MKSLDQIERQAKKQLQSAGIARAPVDVVALAEYLGAEVRPEIAPDDVSGGLYRIEDVPVIGVNAGHHPHRQRFTIAHELGHLLLHDEAEFVDHGYASEAGAGADRRFYRNHVSSEASDTKEIEANRFAASILMPREFLLREVEAHPLPLRSEAVEDLARQFKVSTQAMGFRLQNLGVPLDLV